MLLDADARRRSVCGCVSCAGAPSALTFLLVSGLFYAKFTAVCGLNDPSVGSSARRSISALQLMSSVALLGFKAMSSITSTLPSHATLYTWTMQREPAAGAGPAAEFRFRQEQALGKALGKTDPNNRIDACFCMWHCA